MILVISIRDGRTSVELAGYWTAAELGAALRAGYAIETRPGRPIRLIGRDPEVEMDVLGDRVFDALEYVIEMGSGTRPGADPLPTRPPRPPLTTGYIGDTYQGSSSDNCTQH